MSIGGTTYSSTSSSSSSSFLDLLTSLQPLDLFATLFIPLILFAMTAHAMVISDQPPPPQLTTSSSSLSSSSGHGSACSTPRAASPTANENQVLKPWMHTTATKVHLIILIHGWLGSPSEMTSIQQALESQLKLANDEEQQPTLEASAEDTTNLTLPSDTAVFCHSVTCNDGKTHDGIVMGGSRVAQEINDMIQDILQTSEETIQQVSLSFIGNSLGGLYARAALPHIHWTVNQPTNNSNDEEHNNDNPQLPTLEILPKIFCTTCTPHLGKRGLTYLPLPRVVETGLGYALQPTGQDLFGCSSVMEQLASQEKYVAKLAQFQKRIAYANAFGTDLQVPTATAAFLADTESPHEQDATCPKPFSLRVTTPRDDSVLQQTIQASKVAAEKQQKLHVPATSMSRTLDAMGWTKVFCDVRTKLVSVPIPFQRRGKDGSHDSSSQFDLKAQQQWSSHELKKLMANRIDYDQKWPIPIGHTMLIANAKSPFYAKLNRGGLEFVQQLARDYIVDVLQDENEDGSSSS